MSIGEQGSYSCYLHSSMELLPSMTINLIVALWPLFLLSFMALIFMHRYKIGGRNQKDKLPLGPRRLPIIGHLHLLSPLLHHTFSELSKKHGPLMHLQLGSNSVLVVSSSAMAKQVLKTHDLAFCSRPCTVAFRKYSYNGLDVAAAQYSEHWRDLRKLYILELFSPRRVLSFRPVRHDEVAKVVDSIASRVDLGEPVVNLSEMMIALTNTVTARTAFGTDANGGGEYGASVKSILAKAVELLSGFFAEDYFPGVGTLVDELTGKRRRMERNAQELDEFYQALINEHLDRMQPGQRNSRHDQDLIDTLLGLNEQQPGMTMEHIKAALVDIFIAGTDTSAATVTWALAELARRPSMMKKAQEEVRGVVGSKGKVEEDDLPKINYLKMILNETLRLHPPLPLLLPRESMHHCNINGFDIPPKTTVFVNAWEIGRETGTWELGISR